MKRRETITLFVHPSNAKWARKSYSFRIGRVQIGLLIPRERHCCTLEYTVGIEVSAKGVMNKSN